MIPNIQPSFKNCILKVNTYAPHCPVENNYSIYRKCLGQIKHFSGYV